MKLCLHKKKRHEVLYCCLWRHKDILKRRIKLKVDEKENF
jgi:hypothetical protein